MVQLGMQLVCYYCCCLTSCMSFLSRQHNNTHERCNINHTLVPAGPTVSGAGHRQPVEQSCAVTEVHSQHTHLTRRPTTKQPAFGAADGAGIGRGARLGHHQPGGQSVLDASVLSCSR